MLFVSCMEEEWPWACPSLMVVQWRACSFLQKVPPWELDVSVISARGLHSRTCLFLLSVSFPFSYFFPSFLFKKHFFKIKFSVIRCLLQVKNSSAIIIIIIIVLLLKKKQSSPSLYFFSAASSVYFTVSWFFSFKHFCITLFFLVLNICLCAHTHRFFPSQRLLIY